MRGSRRGVGGGGGCLDIPLPGKFKPIKFHIVTLPKKKAFDITDKRNYVWKNIAFESLS